MHKKSVTFVYRLLFVSVFLLGALVFTGASSSHAFAASKVASVAQITCPPTIREYTSQHNLVEVLQYDLDNYNNGYNLVIDGQFGPKTLAAVKDYQKKYAPPADGVVGPITWNAFKNVGRTTLQSKELENRLSKVFDATRMGHPELWSKFGMAHTHGSYYYATAGTTLCSGATLTDSSTTLRLSTNRAPVVASVPIAMDRM